MRTTIVAHLIYYLENDDMLIKKSVRIIQPADNLI